MDSVLISQPGTATGALEIAETLIRSGTVDVVINRFGGHISSGLRN